jgi:hypothetical protein
VSDTEDETQAIWFTRPEEGLRNIIKELNVVISRRRGPQRIVTKISITLKNLENNHKSRSMSDFLRRFKTTARETRVEARKLRFTNEEVDRILRSTPLPNPVRQPGYQPTDQVAQTQQYFNRRDDAERLVKARDKAVKVNTLIIHFRIRIGTRTLTLS